MGIDWNAAVSGAVAGALAGAVPLAIDKLWGRLSRGRLRAAANACYFASIKGIAVFVEFTNDGPPDSITGYSLMDIDRIRMIRGPIGGTATFDGLEELPAGSVRLETGERLTGYSFFPVRDEALVARLRQGEQITATMNLTSVPYRPHLLTFQIGYST